MDFIPSDSRSNVDTVYKMYSIIKENAIIWNQMALYKNSMVNLDHKQISHRIVTLPPVTI